METRKVLWHKVIKEWAKQVERETKEQVKELRRDVDQSGDLEAGAQLSHLEGRQELAEELLRLLGTLKAWERPLVA